MQRRIMINGKKCAIFKAIMLRDTDYSYDVAYFSAPKDNWGDFLLYILYEDVYVLPAVYFLTPRRRR
jgi:hypothetical protein